MEFKEIYSEVSRINKKDPASNAERLGKLFEEAGELAKAVNKSNGRKVIKLGENEHTIREELVDEAADTIQNVISIIDGYGITAEEVLNAMIRKNNKWESKVDKNYGKENI